MTEQFSCEIFVQLQNRSCDERNRERTSDDRECCSNSVESCHQKSLTSKLYCEIQGPVCKQNKNGRRRERERDRESDESSARLSVVPEQCTKTEGSDDAEKEGRERKDQHLL